jgi:lysophospholipid acyltransferase (LPLAT)-like uncharacterized protein
MRPHYWISARGLYLYARMVQATARYQLSGEAHLDALLESGQPFIAASWHGVTMMAVGYVLRKFAGAQSRLQSIVPDDWRGVILAEYARLHGIKTFAVSMEEESLVAARRFLQLVQHLKSGMNGFIFPDGPDGPSGIPKPGVAFLARKSGAPILPYGVYTPSRYQLRRWDRYSLPFPFSRITISLGEPLFVGRDEDTETTCHRIAAAINQAMAEAQARH